MSSRNPLVVLAVTVALVLFAAPAMAGKGGSGHANNSPSRTTASIAASCNPCAAGSTIHFSGSGFDASQGVAKLDMNGGWTAAAVVADGTVSFDWPFFQQPYTYTVSIYQYGSGGKLTLVAQTTVVVQ